MRVRHFILIFGILGTSLAQKNPKHGGQGHKQGGHGGGQQNYDYSGGQGQYQGAGQGAGHGGGHGGGNYNTQPLATAAKHTYPLLLSDSRTLNQDGTINFQYAADNGLQQGETVDPDGTRRGFYSYPGADGKPITVKYTAGKNGFIAEGDHLPKQPNVPGHSENDEGAYPGGVPHDGAGHRGHSPQANRPQYAAPNPSYGQGSGGDKYQLAHAPEPQQHHGGNHGGGHGGLGGGHGAGHGAPPRFNVGGPYNQGGHRPQPDYQGISPAGAFGRGQGQGFDFGPVNYGAPSQSSNRYKEPPVPQAVPRPLPQGGHNLGQGFPGHNPAEPHNGRFDLGNGGQFSINFNPGQSREVQIGGDYANLPQNSQY